MFQAALFRILQYPFLALLDCFIEARKKELAQVFFDACVARPSPQVVNWEHFGVLASEVGGGSNLEDRPIFRLRFALLGFRRFGRMS